MEMTLYMIDFVLSIVVIENRLFEHCHGQSSYNISFVRVFIAYIYRSLQYFIIFHYFQALLKDRGKSEKYLNCQAVNDLQQLAD